MTEREARIKAAIRFVVLPYWYDEDDGRCEYPMKVGPFSTRDEAESTARRMPFEHFVVEPMVPLDAYLELFLDTRVLPEKP